MKRNPAHRLWRWVGSLSALSFLLFLAGFVLAVNQRLLPPQAVERPLVPQPDKPAGAPAPGGLTRLVALGDSLTRGTGDADGQGYVGRVRQALEKVAGHPISLTNLAVIGQESGGLEEQLKQRQVQTLVAQADAVLFTIGGNDLFRQSGGIYELDEHRAARAVNALAARFDGILKQLRSLNPSAPIVYVSLYNPFGDTEAAQLSAKFVLEWNSRASAAAARYPRVYVVPVYDLFQGKEQAYLYTDHFHPNRDGYAAIAERVLQVLR